MELCRIAEIIRSNHPQSLLILFRFLITLEMRSLRLIFDMMETALKTMQMMMVLVLLSE
jgi:hypothetical protein